MASELRLAMTRAERSAGYADGRVRHNNTRSAGVTMKCKVP
jgi:hypothetical protein